VTTSLTISHISLSSRSCFTTSASPKEPTTAFRTSFLYEDSERRVIRAMLKGTLIGQALA